MLFDISGVVYTQGCSSRFDRFITARGSDVLEGLKKAERARTLFPYIIIEQFLVLTESAASFWFSALVAWQVRVPNKRNIVPRQPELALAYCLLVTSCRVTSSAMLPTSTITAWAVCRAHVDPAWVPIGLFVWWVSTNRSQWCHHEFITWLAIFILRCPYLEQYTSKGGSHKDNPPKHVHTHHNIQLSD